MELRPRLSLSQTHFIRPPSEFWDDKIRAARGGRRWGCGGLCQRPANTATQTPLCPTRPNQIFSIPFCDSSSLKVPPASPKASGYSSMRLWPRSAPPCSKPSRMSVAKNVPARPMTSNPSSSTPAWDRSNCASLKCAGASISTLLPSKKASPASRPSCWPWPKLMSKASPPPSERPKSTGAPSSPPSPPAASAAPASSSAMPTRHGRRPPGRLPFRPLAALSPAPAHQQRHQARPSGTQTPHPRRRPLLQRSLSAAPHLRTPDGNLRGPANLQMLSLPSQNHPPVTLLLQKHPILIHPPLAETTNLQKKSCAAFDQANLAMI